MSNYEFYFIIVPFALILISYCTILIFLFVKIIFKRIKKIMTFKEVKNHDLFDTLFTYEFKEGGELISKASDLCEQIDLIHLENDFKRTIYISVGTFLRYSRPYNSPIRSIFTAYGDFIFVVDGKKAERIEVKDLITGTIYTTLL